jgi:hypothetical protein
MLHGSPSVGAGLLHVSRAGSRRAAAALLLRRVFPSAAYMRAWEVQYTEMTGKPMNQRWGGLPGAHLRRLAWLVRHAPRGLRAFRAARRG